MEAYNGVTIPVRVVGHNGDNGALRPVASGLDAPTRLMALIEYRFNVSFWVLSRIGRCESSVWPSHQSTSAEVIQTVRDKR